jgi:hypothetical protein
MLLAVENKSVKECAAMEWSEDRQAESVLNLVGLSWNIVEINLGDIDWDESANNCARMRNPLNSEKIEEYRTAMSLGDVFPMPVVEITGGANGRDRYVILGGNQRCNALKMLHGESASLAVYCVKPLISSDREAVIRSLNSRHGWGTDKSERLEHAVYLVRSCGMLADDAARLMMVSSTNIHRHIRAEDMRRSLAKSGVDANKFPISTLDSIGRIKDESIQLEVAKVAEKFSPSAEQTRLLASKIENEKSAAGRNKALRDWSNEMSSLEKNNPKGRKTVSRPRREKFLRLLESFSEFLERGNDGECFSTLDELQCNAIKDGDKVKLLCRKIIARLSVIGVE